MQVLCRSHSVTLQSLAEERRVCILQAQLGAQTQNWGKWSHFVRLYCPKKGLLSRIARGSTALMPNSPKSCMCQLHTVL